MILLRCSIHLENSLLENVSSFDTQGINCCFFFPFVSSLQFLYIYLSLSPPSSLCTFKMLIFSWLLSLAIFFFTTCLLLFECICCLLLISTTVSLNTIFIFMPSLKYVADRLTEHQCNPLFKRVLTGWRAKAVFPRYSLNSRYLDSFCEAHLPHKHFKVDSDGVCMGFPFKQSWHAFDFSCRGPHIWSLNYACSEARQTAPSLSFGFSVSLEKSIQNWKKQTKNQNYFKCTIYWYWIDYQCYTSTSNIHFQNLFIVPNKVKFAQSCPSNSLWPCGLYSPWNSPGQNTAVCSLSLFQWFFPTQESNWGPVLQTDSLPAELPNKSSTLWMITSHRLSCQPLASSIAHSVSMNLPIACTSGKQYNTVSVPFWLAYFI